MNVSVDKNLTVNFKILFILYLVLTCVLVGDFDHDVPLNSAASALCVNIRVKTFLEWQSCHSPVMISLLVPYRKKNKLSLLPY